MAGHSRSQNGVASLAYVPAIHVLERKAWTRGTSPRMTRKVYCPLTCPSPTAGLRAKKPSGWNVTDSRALDITG